MAIPTDNCRPSCGPRILCRSALFMSTAIFALRIDGASSVPIHQQTLKRTDQDITTKSQLNNNIALNTTEQTRSCSVDLSNPNFVDSLGNEQEYCDRGMRKSSVANPCRDGQPCCPCEPGTFQPVESVCDTCDNHTKCNKVKISGNGYTDNVCAQPGDIQTDTTDSLSTHPSYAGTEPGETDTGQDAVTDNPSIQPPDTGMKREEEDTGQDEQNSAVLKVIAFLVTLMLVVVITMIIVFCAVNRCIKRSGTYSVAPTQASSHEMVRLQSIKSNSGEESKLQEEI